MFFFFFFSCAYVKVVGMYVYAPCVCMYESGCFQSYLHVHVGSPDQCHESSLITFYTLLFLRQGLAVEPRLTWVATTNQACSKHPISSSEAGASAACTSTQQWCREIPILFPLLVYQLLRHFTSRIVILKWTKS